MKLRSRVLFACALLLGAVPSAGCWLVGQGAGASHPGFAASELPRFFPLRKDLSWGYEVRDGARQLIAHMRMEVQQVDQVGLAKTAVLLRVRDLTQGPSFITKAGLRVAPEAIILWDLEGEVQAAETLLALPLKPGSSWALRQQGPTNQASITGVEGVCTPEGAFSDCLRVEQVTGSSVPGQRPTRLMMWLAKDLGLVRFREERSGGEVEEGLLSSVRDPEGQVPEGKPCP